MSLVVVPNRINLLDMCAIQDDPYASGQHLVDFQKVKKAGFEGVYLKSSQYSKTRDYCFESMRDRALAAGLRVGAYHFCAHDTDPKEQMEYFYRVSGGLGKKPGELPPMLDWEFCTPSKYKDHPAHCVRWIEEASHYAEGRWYPDNDRMRIRRFPVVYTYPFYASGHQPELKGSGDTLGTYPLCLASYKSDHKGQLVPWLPLEDQTSLHPVPLPWLQNRLWQYSGNKGLKVPGVPGDCDRQLFNGTSGDWAEFLGLDRPAHQTIKEIKE